MNNDKSNGMSNKELIIEVRDDVKSILSNMAKHTEWIKNNSPRINSHSKRLRIVEISIAAIIVIPTIVLFLHRLGLINI